MFRLALLLLLLPACGFGGESVGSAGSGVAGCAAPDTALVAGFESGLDPSGCHYAVTAANDDESVRLLLDTQAFADVAIDGSGAATYTLPDADVRLVVEVGCELNAEFCTDNVEMTSSVTATYTATAGTLTVSGTRDEASYTDEGGYEATVTVTLEGVVLEDASGNVVTIDTLTWADVRLFNPLLG